MDVGVASQSCEFQVIPTLLDSGANATFIDKAVAEWLGLMLEALANPIRVFNMDGSHNSAGDVTHAVKLTVDFLGHRKELRAEVTNLGKNSLILGYTWLKKQNPSIDWEKGLVKFHRCPRSCLMLQDRAQHLASLNEEDEREALEWIHQAKVEAPAKKPTRTPEELVPPAITPTSTSSRKRPLVGFPFESHGITPLISRTHSNQRRDVSFHCHLRSKRKFQSSLMNSSLKGTSTRPSPNKCLPYSLCRRKTDASG